MTAAGRPGAARLCVGLEVMSRHGERAVPTGNDPVRTVVSPVLCQRVLRELDTTLADQELVLQRYVLGQHRGRHHLSARLAPLVSAGTMALVHDKHRLPNVLTAVVTQDCSGLSNR